MAIKWDKEKIILSVVGSLATIVIGYLVWRHEQTVQAAENAQQQNAAAEQNAELQQEISALPTYTQGGGGSSEVGDTGADSNVQSPPNDENIAAILEAFFGSQSNPANNPSTPAPPTGTPVGGPVPVDPNPVPVTNPTPVVPTPPSDPVGLPQPVGHPIAPKNKAPIITQPHTQNPHNVDTRIN